jgi:hypothetical protein
VEEVESHKHFFCPELIVLQKNLLITGGLMIDSWENMKFKDKAGDKMKESKTNRSVISLGV